jgi:hypothetical protein
LSTKRGFASPRPSRYRLALHIGVCSEAVINEPLRERAEANEGVGDGDVTKQYWYKPGYWRWWWHHRAPTTAKIVAGILVALLIIVSGFATAHYMSSASASPTVYTYIRTLKTAPLRRSRSNRSPSATSRSSG